MQIARDLGKSYSHSYRRAFFPEYIEDYKWEPNKMKIYALKYKDEYFEFSDKEMTVADSYKFENVRLKDHLKIVSGTFTEDGVQ